MDVSDSGGPGNVLKYDQQRSGGFPIFSLLEELLYGCQ